jgi:uncharacterized lipoprotein YmbA
MKYKHGFIGLLMAVLLGGCASAPSNFYTLVSLKESPTALASSVSVDPYVLSDISVPSAADQIPLVVQDDNGRLQLLEYDRWGAPLSAQLQNALSRALTEQLGFPPQQNLSAAMQDKRNTRVRVSYQAFDMVPARYAQALVVWQLVFAGTDKSLTCYSRLHQTVKPGVAELVLAQQKNVQQLAEQIAQAVRTRAQPTGIVCQAK